MNTLTGGTPSGESDIPIDAGNSFKDVIHRASPWGRRHPLHGCRGEGGIGAQDRLLHHDWWKRDRYDVFGQSRNFRPEDGHLDRGKAGAGHFVKMVHNGIEYGMMQAYGEGFEILAASEFADNFVYADIAHLWNQGSVIRSWLLELAEAALRKDADFLTEVAMSTIPVKAAGPCDSMPAQVGAPA